MEVIRLWAAVAGLLAAAGVLGAVWLAMQSLVPLALPVVLAGANGAVGALSWRLGRTAALVQERR